MAILIWHRQVPYNTSRGIKYMAIREKYNATLLKSVLAAKKGGKQMDQDDDWDYLSWLETVFVYGVILVGFLCFCGFILGVFYATQ
ncbi:MAG: hypothetical protein A3K22_02130 [Deltaproteobacteria bacterium RBG_16_42_7]|nr:MAG: hypothetical protein A3K22_02130 [Deltaproteobacteria bacterium RBG_16_42_7]